jgi:hypothetical protein
MSAHALSLARAYRISKWLVHNSPNKAAPYGGPTGELTRDAGLCTAAACMNTGGEIPNIGFNPGSLAHHLFRVQQCADALVPCSLEVGVGESSPLTEFLCDNALHISSGRYAGRNIRRVKRLGMDALCYPNRS